VSETLFATRKLTKRYGGLVACREVSIELHPGELVGLIGPNGAGKTTCFNLITGADEPSEGTILFRNLDVTTARDHSASLSRPSTSGAAVATGQGRRRRPSKRPQYFIALRSARLNTASYIRPTRVE